MARLAVDQAFAKKRPLSRDEVWKSIRNRREGFTLLDLEADTRQNVGTIKSYVHGLLAAGYLKARPAERFKTKFFDLVNDVGLEAPRVRRNGEPVTQGAPSEQMWRTMKIVGTFTARDLAIQASLPDSPVSEVAAHDYCKNLAKAGYLAVVGGGKAGRLGKALYRFVSSRNTGPLPPMIQRLDAVYDPNTRAVVWQAEPRA